MATSHHVYRPPFLPVLALVFAAAVVAACVITWGMAFFGLPVPGVISFTFLKLLCVFYLWAVVMAFMIVQSMTAAVLPEGIRARTFWGVSRTIPWGDMASVDRIGLGPARFLRLFPESGTSPLWIPLFMKSLAAFREETRTYIGAKHPLFPFASEG